MKSISLFPPPWFFPLVCAILLSSLASGCNRGMSEKERNRREMRAKSDQIWQEAARKKTESGGRLTLGNQTVDFADMTLHLGDPVTPGDEAGGQHPSQLKTSAQGPVSLEISSLPIEGIFTAAQLPGQSVSITELNSPHAQIITSDGKTWKLTDATLLFNRTEKKVVFITLEGNVIDASGTSNEKIRIAGDIRAKVEGPSSAAGEE